MAANLDNILLEGVHKIFRQHASRALVCRILVLAAVGAALAAEGYFVLAPIRENSARGRGFQDYEDVYREIVMHAIDHVKALPGVDSSRIALAGFSMGGLVSFKVALERNDLRAVALLAPGKRLRLNRYERGGGHELFYDVGYWWDDLKTFLHEHLVAR